VARVLSCRGIFSSLMRPTICSPSPFAEDNQLVKALRVQVRPS
jgi:hypothetical protein